MGEISNSTYVDFTGYRITDQSTVVGAYQLNPNNIKENVAGINVAIVLDRAHDPTSLLSQDWATRQKSLAELESKGTLWTTYGTDKTQFDTVRSALEQQGLHVLDGKDSQNHGDYVSSAESRTIWVEINTVDQFNALFGTKLFYNDQNDNAFQFWNGNLSLPTDWHVKGLWVDTSNYPPASNLTPGVSTTLPQGHQSDGSALSETTYEQFSSQTISTLYNFPLAGQNVATGAVGLIEPGIGTALPSSQTKTFQELLTAFLTTVHQSGTGKTFVQGENGQEYNADDGGERSLDVGVVASAVPNSDIHLYNGSGGNGNAQASTYTAIQSAVWDPSHPVSVLSSSFGDGESMSPGSPFYEAYKQLFIDAALHNITFFNALGDGGSGNETGNGLTNLEYNVTSPYGVLVGGTSISTLSVAKQDPTILPTIVTPALQGDPATIWQLVTGGLTSMPADVATLQSFVEAVWNNYFVSGTTISPAYTENHTSSGGVDPTQPAPSYQVEYGLDPVTSDPLAQHGRGAPDVSVNAGGNTYYTTPNADMVGTGANGGTSAASPFWASLTVQFNAIFADQGLPALGYMNDLLYIASVIAPASFNDVTIGNNTSSYTMGGPYDSGGTPINPTGFGYSAVPGYDTVSGLGSPNGLLLARALTTIAHAQMSFADVPDIIVSDNANGWKSGTDQTVLFQTTADSVTGVAIHVGATTINLTSAATGAYAWTSRLAEQSLQSDFDPALVRFFDGYSQGALTQATVAAGAAVSVTVDSLATKATQAELSSSFGFADFFSGPVPAGNGVRMAQAVAVAETAGAADDQHAIVSLRQNGQDNLALMLYRVDNQSGAIGSLLPGDAGYAAAAQARAYTLQTGGTSINGPGYGNFGTAELIHVDAGDIVAMRLTDTTTGNTYWSFAQANEKVNGTPVGHLWNYGANTWGWEDRPGTASDRDFNDLIVGISFTDAVGHRYLAS